MEKDIDNAVDDPLFPFLGQGLVAQDHDGQEGVNGPEKHVGEIIGLDVFAQDALRLPFPDNVLAKSEQGVEFVFSPEFT